MAKKNSVPKKHTMTGIAGNRLDPGAGGLSCSGIFSEFEEISGKSSENEINFSEKKR